MKSQKVDFSIRRPILPKPDFGVTELCLLINTVNEEHTQFYEEQKRVVLKLQQEAEAEAPQFIPPAVQKYLPSQVEPLSIYRALGTLLRRVDAVHANQELMWDSRERSDSKFTRRTDFGKLERWMMDLSVESKDQSGD